MNPDRSVLVATLPKSGTWYSHCFFWSYHQLCQHQQEFSKGWRPDLEKVLIETSMPNDLLCKDSLGFRRMFICHAICPGFEESADRFLGQWQNLHFSLNYNFGQEWLTREGEWEKLDPAKNPDARIVFLYRNPLDHFVSYHRQVQPHPTKPGVSVMPDNTTEMPTDIREFVMQYSALDCFIKQFYSYLVMQRRFPNNVLMVPYETLTATPREAFAGILAFIGAPVDAQKQPLFECALEMSNKDKLKEFEGRINRSLAGAPPQPNSRHIRSGAVGGWKEKFNELDLVEINGGLRRFGLSLDMFKIA